MTSRQILELTPEREIAVGPLPVPGVQAFRRSGVQEGQIEDRNTRTHEHLNTLLRNESVALFVDRAQRVSPDFQLTRANAAAVVELCRRLEGIPLAIELAAARAQRLSPASMLAQLGRRFDLLVSRKRDLPSRHQTLRAAIDWSYQLLSPEVQRFLARLFAFRGGFGAGAAAAVSEESRAAAHLEQLRDNSLVLAEGSGPEPRYRLLEMLREFAAEELSLAGRAEVARRHACYFLALAEAAEPALRGRPEQKQWLDRLEEEHDNMRAALDWAEENQERDFGLRLAAALGPFWMVRGYLAEGRRRLSELLAASKAAGRSPARARALNVAAAIAMRQGDYVAARVFCEEALAAWRHFGDRSGVAVCLLSLAAVMEDQGVYPLACRYYEESLALFRQLQDQRGISVTLNNYGLALVCSACFDRAGQLLEQALSLNRERGDWLGTATNLNNLGLARLRAGRMDEARSLFVESLQIKGWLGNRDGVPYGLEGLAELAILQGQMGRAVCLFAAARQLREAVGHPRCPPSERANDEHLLATARGALGGEAFAVEWSKGHSLTIEQAITYALGAPSAP